MKKSIMILFGILCLGCMGCSGKEKYNQLEMPYGVDASTVEDTIGSTPNTTETNGTMKDYIYNQIDAYGYSGVMTYHFNSDGSILMYTEWKTKATSSEECREVYSKIYNQLKDENGDCAESKTDDSAIATWDNEEYTTTLSYDYSKKDPYVYVTRIQSAK